MVEETVILSTALFNDNKPVIVRVKRKNYQPPVEAFWLEINERPVKRPLLDFEKLSIIDSASKVEELKPKKLFAQHVDTMSSSNVAVDVLQSFVASKPNSADAVDSKAKYEYQRRSNKIDSKQKQLLVKAKETQEVLAKNARFKQIWKSRKEKDPDVSNDALHDMCHLFDVERVDVKETTEVHGQEKVDEEDHRQMYSFLTLLQEFIPSAAEDIDSDIDDHVIKQASIDDHVYDLYAVKDDNVSMLEENTLSLCLGNLPQCPCLTPNPFLDFGYSVQVNDNDDLYDEPDDQDLQTDDSNAEDSPMNDYPDEGSDISQENSEVFASGFSRSKTISDSEDDIIINLVEDDDEGYY